jgi:hypothetical protein
MRKEEVKEWLEMLKYHELTISDVAKITGNKLETMKCIVTPCRLLSRNLKLALYIHKSCLEKAKIK